MLEYKLLANLLLEGKLGKAKGKLKEKDFVDTKAWQIYREMHRLEDSVGHFSKVLLDERLKFGDGFYAHIEKFATIPQDIPVLVRQIKGETWKKGILGMLGLTRCSRCKQPVWETKEIKNTPAGELKERMLNYIREYELVSSNGFSMSDALWDVLEYLENKREDEMTPTPWGELNKYIVGITKGKLYILGGRPSMGKTTLLYNLILSLAHQGRKSLIFQLEGATRSGIIRMLPTLSGVANDKIWRKDLSDEEFDRVRDATMKLSELPIVFSTYHRPTISQVREEIEKYNPDFVCLDYLQLFKLEGVPGEKKYQQIGYLASEFSSMCSEYDIAFMCLSQLSREVEHRKPPQPILSDLRESGDIEQAADVVIFVNYPYKLRYVYSDYQEASQNELFLNVAKNRDGRCSDPFSLRFIPEFYRVEDQDE